MVLRTRLEREHFTSSVDKCRKTSLGLAWDVSFKLPFNGHFINEIKGTTLPEITEREFCYQDVLEALWFRQSQEHPQQRSRLVLKRDVGARLAYQREQAPQTARCADRL